MKKQTLGIAVIAAGLSLCAGGVWVHFEERAQRQEAARQAAAMQQAKEFARQQQVRQAAQTLQALQANANAVSDSVQRIKDEAGKLRQMAERARQDNALRLAAEQAIREIYHQRRAEEPADIRYPGGSPP